jgi:hypothetical protein
MKKLLFVLIVAGLAFGWVAAPAQAALPTSDLTTLASYFPAETPIVIASRIDPGFIAELDDLVERIGDALPPGTMPPVSLAAMLNAQIEEQYGGDFDEIFGDWLGDTMMVGLVSMDVMMDDEFSNDDEVPALAAFEITDRDGAEAFIELLAEIEGVEVKSETDGDFTVFSVGGVPVQIAINDEVLLASWQIEDLRLDGDFLALDDESTFTDTVAMLPADDYSMIGYFNLADAMGQMMGQMMGEMRGMPFGNMPMRGQADMVGLMSMLYGNIPASAVGLTILDGRSLTIDAAQASYNLSALEPLIGDIDFTLDSTPLDLSFAAHIPANAPLVLHDANVGADLDTGLDVLSHLGAVGMQFAAQFEPDAEQFMPLIRRFDGPALREYFDLTFEVITGLSLNDDVFPVMEGNFAAYLRAYPSDATVFTGDAVILLEITDEDAAANLIDKTEVTLGEYEADYSRDGDVLTIPGVIRAFFPDDFPQSMLDTPELDFLVGMNGEIIAIGSRNGVTDSLDGSGDMLADDPAFIDAQQFFLEDATSLAYIGFDPIVTLIDDAAGAADAMNASERELAEMKMARETIDALLSSAAITAQVNADGSMVSRASLTLKAE